MDWNFLIFPTKTFEPFREETDDRVIWVPIQEKSTIIRLRVVDIVNGLDILQNIKKNHHPQFSII